MRVSEFISNVLLSLNIFVRVVHQSASYRIENLELFRREIGKKDKPEIDKEATNRTSTEFML